MCIYLCIWFNFDQMLLLSWIPVLQSHFTLSLYCFCWMCKCAALANRGSSFQEPICWQVLVAFYGTPNEFAWNTISCKASGNLVCKVCDYNAFSVTKEVLPQTSPLKIHGKMAAVSSSFTFDYVLKLWRAVILILNWK